jgi:hypothetical protein
MGALIRNIDRIRAATSAHVTLIHHAPKDGARGKGGRGHSSLWGAIDTEIDVDRDATTKIATAMLWKHRNGVEGLTVNFKLEAVPLGTDGDGDTVSSCVIIPASAQERAEAHAKMSAPCAIALASLRLAIEEGGEIPPASAHIPANVRAVPVELWRKFAYAKDISGGVQNAKRMAFKRASEQLQARQIVASWQDWVWLP